MAELTLVVAVEQEQVLKVMQVVEQVLLTDSVGMVALESSL
jgi:hypothetical protein